MISLKLLAAMPSIRKHTDDLRAINPDNKEIIEAVRFVRSIDDSSNRISDLHLILSELGYDLNDITKNNKD